MLGGLIGRERGRVEGGEPFPIGTFGYLVQRVDDDELYEEYIEQYTAARAAGRAAVLRSLTAVPQGVQFAQWLETHRHRRALLEAMAVAYISSETPLLDVLRDQLGDRAPLLDALPADWQATFADWLTQTGLFDRNRPRLRFLHQTFAEHLAASARARALPPFDPATPQWQDVIAGCLLGTSAEEQVMLHHLHLFSATGVLDWLQQGSQAARDAAGELINQGCPVGDAQLEAYLARVADKVTTGSWTDSELRDLAGLTRHASVRTHLDSLLHRADVGAAAKIQIVDLLRERSPDVRREAAALLRTFIADTCPHHVRRQAATVLARLAEEEEKTTAARVLYELAVDADAPYGERRQAAEALGKLGGDQRQLAATALERLAFEPARSRFQRRAAAESMGDVDVDGARAAQLLCEVAADPAMSANARREAAEGLIELGGAHRAHAAEFLVGLTKDITAPVLERALALASTAAIEPAWRPRAVEMLCGVLADGTVAAYDRQRAAARLAEFGGDCRETAAAALDAMASVPVEDAGTRVQAATSMAEFGGEHRTRAGLVLHDIARDPEVDLDERLSAARALSGLGRTHRQLAAAAMPDMGRGYSPAHRGSGTGARRCTALDRGSQLRSGQQDLGREPVRSGGRRWPAVGAPCLRGHRPRRVHRPRRPSPRSRCSGAPDAGLLARGSPAPARSRGESIAWLVTEPSRWPSSALSGPATAPRPRGNSHRPLSLSPMRGRIGTRSYGACR